MSFDAQIIDQFVIGAVKHLKPEFLSALNIGDDKSKKKSIAFTQLVIQTILGLNEEEACDCIVNGPQDLAIDAIYYERPSQYEIIITLIQSKYKERLDAESNFSKNEIGKIIHAIEIISNPNTDIEVNPRLEERIEDIRSMIAERVIPQFRIILCSNGKKWNNDAQNLIDLKQQQFGDTVTWEYIGPQELFSLLKPDKPIDENLKLKGQAILENFDYKRAITGKMLVTELATLMDKHDNALLQKNIRGYLKNSSVNKEIITTLQNPKEYNNFYFYNNGITFICSRFQHSATLPENWTVKVEGLQIINGGQTVRTVQQAINEIGMDKLSQVEVLVRIYEVSKDSDEFINYITYTTNNQNPVILRDLRSNDDIQKKLEASIEQLPEVDNFKFVYLRKQSTIETDRKEFTLSGANTKKITSAVVAETVLAIWRQRPHEVNIFKTDKNFGKLYDVIFNDTLNGAQAVIATRIHNFCENKRKHPQDNSPVFLSYGSRLITMQIGRYLLRDIGIEYIKNLEKLNHKNFIDAYNKFNNEKENYYKLAIQDIINVLEKNDLQLNLFESENREVSLPLSKPPRYLQNLSAAFRRPDIVTQILRKELQQKD